MTTESSTRATAIPPPCDMMYKPDSTLGLEVFIDADFAGNWDNQYATNDCDTA